jgi:hypothetical protein
MLLTHVSYGSVFGAPRSSCTTHLPLTRRLLRCLSLKGEVGARSEDLHPVFPGTGRGIIYQSLSGVSGADPRNCTSHLVLTKDAFRYQNLEGNEWHPGSDSNARGMPSEGLLRPPARVCDWHPRLESNQ